MMDKFILKIKRANTPFYAFLRRLAKSVIRFNLPTIRAVHLPLYYFDYSLKIVIPNIFHVLWSIPLFKARCENAGKNLRLPNGIPLILGNHLKIFLGDNVRIGRSTIGASKVFDDPVLRIGDNSSIGYGSVISVAKEVVIGNNCMIAPYCLIMDSDDHPIDPAKRISGMSVSREDVKPVRIGDNVWIGSNCVILKGVNVKDNSIIAAHSVVTKDVAKNCVYAGNPARPTKSDIDKY
jgi:acetyltransferase-like isoleucine patch superfamily enzyme